ncbi:ECF RNA polymerase sigma factor SigK [Sinomonas cellulolyticus]|uniref:ECF RNA polymerase sigma factor SigK n=1 Tax=Sinomonas cellulolyticus TaxID=2801916 RepID=A0ABS1K685_9MICC|nr:MULTISPECIES: ECF RNA polymerase sigma factor SigK [Sinomonas]MBL0706968.1 ECF RNA polymerase sigma factor SigK [Sinomonas cellulolyticus]
MPEKSNGTPAPDLDDLMARVARGDQEAFGRLYDALAPLVHGLVLRVVRDPAQSEEVTQEVFLEVWQQARRFDADRGRVRAWITVMAHRRAVDRVRAAQAATDRDLRQGIRDYRESYDDVEHTVEVALESERVNMALESLTDVQRQAIRLAYYGGYTYGEVAETLGLPLGTVKTRIRDGMIRLRDVLGVSHG